MNAYKPISYVYADKIKSRKTNKATGEPWKIDDVPEAYRDEVAAILAEN